MVILVTTHYGFTVHRYRPACKKKLTFEVIKKNSINQEAGPQTNFLCSSIQNDVSLSNACDVTAKDRKNDNQVNKS